MQIASWPQYQQKSNDGFRNDGGSVKYQKRNAICKENQKLTEWEEHFDSVLNRREPPRQINTRTYPPNHLPWRRRVEARRGQISAKLIYAL